MPPIPMIRTAIFGVIVWLIPFASGFFVIDQSGNFTVDIFIAKSMFLLIGNLVGAVLIFVLFSSIKGRYIASGVAIGVIWMIINWLLDILVLLRLSGDTISAWFGSVGVRYFSMLIMAVLVGAIARKFSCISEK